MIRTQIYFDQNLYTNLQIGARLNKTTVSEYIRSLLKEQIKTNSRIKSKKSLSDLAKQAPKLGKSNIIKNFNKYLPKEWR